MPQRDPNIIIRPAAIKDARKIAPMLAYIENQETDLYRTLERMCLARPHETLLVAEMDGEVAGFAALRVVPTLSAETPYAEITELYVADKTQRERIGRAFTGHLEALAREKGAAHLVLLTGLRNTPSKNLYRALGYRDYALAMRKTLKRREHT